ncbi:ATP-dependent nuclease [Pedobacter nyackensis]|uniref:ATP-dependent nuclease n=1 Tax=Pedobacter nyackensis TaxID=475255 RepID=UPI00292E49B4|nr:AAA family ATPase [Pedobacter nyackensis]
MKIDYFFIKGFRRIKEAKILCGEATFLIGENNIGKSTILKAMEIFFSAETKLPDHDYFKIDEIDFQVDEIVFEAKFYDLPDESNNWRGFKGRVISEMINSQQSNCLYYRKSFPRGGNLKREMKTCTKSIKEEYKQCKSLNDYVSVGIAEEIIKECFGEDTDWSKNLTAKDKERLDLISELWDVDETENDWANNPGGIEGNISIKLPKFLLIPAENRKEEIEATGGALQKTMKELFDEVRGASENYQQAQHYLNLLALELDPEDNQKEFGKMLVDINKIIGGVFTDSRIHISTNLSDPGSSIRPSFDIEMSSNVRTKPERQGMGAIRSTVFALLRYREQFVERKRQQGIEIRPLIIGFEEPEMYLHPNAASLMREKLYELATSSNSKIICTTHSPYMIDLSRKIDEDSYPKQVLNLLSLKIDFEHNISVTNIFPFNTTKAFKELQNEDKQFVKFLLKIDDSIAKVFFCRRVIIVEGDTEELLIKETIQRLPEEKMKAFLCNYQIVKARGKAVIISLVKYLHILGIEPFVIHDEDTEEGAVKFNNPILVSLNNLENRRLMIKYTIEDILGYPEPKTEKPYKAYKHINENWGEDWAGVHIGWKTLFEERISPELFN